jgi:hypothetical protein
VIRPPSDTRSHARADVLALSIRGSAQSAAPCAISHQQGRRAAMAGYQAIEARLSRTAKRPSALPVLSELPQRQTGRPPSQTSIVS